MCVLSYNFKKIIIVFEKSSLEFVRNEFLAKTLNYSIGSAFSGARIRGHFIKYVFYNPFTNTWTGISITLVALFNIL